MKIKLWIVLAALILSLSPSLASAQAGRDRYDNNRDRYDRRQREMRDWEYRGRHRIDRNIRYLNRVIIIINNSNMNATIKIRLIRQINQKIIILIQIRDRMRHNRSNHDQMYRDYQSIRYHENIIYSQYSRYAR